MDDFKPGFGSEEASSVGDDTSATVQERYRGTAADRHDMAVLGKKQVLRRNFRFVTMLGFASTVMLSWETLPIYIAFPLVDGGSPILFWGTIAASLGMTLVYASLSEIASMSPTAGGQYHWVSELAPPSCQRQLSYCVGWLTGIGWQTYNAGVYFIEAQLIQGMIEFNDASYVPQPWHITLITIAVAVSVIAFNTAFAHRLPWLQGAALVIHVSAFIGIVVTLLTLTPKRSAYDALLNFQDNGGWGNRGLSAMIGLIYPVNSLVGLDCSVHMSEEINDASRVLPNAIMTGAPLNALMNMAMVLTLVFCLGNPDDILSSTDTEPFIRNIFYRATNSYAGTNVMVAVILLMMTFGCTTQLATASRQLWSFARDRGLPLSTFFARVSPTWNVPFPAVFLSFIITCLIALLNLGSNAVLNAIVSLSSVSVLASYFVTISCLVWRRLRGAPLPPRRWSLGRWGLLINVSSLVFILPPLFFGFWPLAQPVTPQNLNWSSVMFCGVLAIAAVYYLLEGRRKYTGPVVLVKREE